MNDVNDKNLTQTEENQHANLSELILIRDGGESRKSAHVRECEFCQARLEDVCVAAKSLQETLLFSAEMPVPDSAWQNIEARLRAKGVVEKNDFDTPLGAIDQTDLSGTAMSVPQHVAQGAKSSSIWSSMNTAIYSLALAIVFTGLVSLYTFNGQQQARVETLELQASIRNLMDNSRGLERVLQQVVDQRGGIGMSVADRSAIDRLQWRLMMVDQQIHESESSDDVSYEQIKALWGDRIEALTELNELYYANHITVREGTF